MKGGKARLRSFALNRGRYIRPAFSLAVLRKAALAGTALLSWPQQAAAQAQTQAPVGPLGALLEDFPRNIWQNLDAHETLIGALAIGTLFCTVTGVAALLQTKKALVTTRREHAARIAALTTRLERAEALVGAEASILIAWNGGAMPEVSGDFARIPSVPGAAEDILNWRGWLTASSAEAMEGACHNLVERGEACRVLVRTAGSAASLEAIGRVVAGRAVLRLRDITQFALQTAELTEEVRRLRHENSLSHALLENLPAPIWLRGADGSLRWANRAFVSLVERSSLDDAIKHNSWLVGQEERAALDAARTEKGFSTLPLRFVSQGTQKMMQVFDLRTHEGRIGLAFDVSEADNLRKELGRHIEAHKRTFDQLKSAVAIFSAEQRLVFYNEAYQKLWRLDPDWLDSGPTEADILDRLRAAHRLPETPDYRTWRDKHLECYRVNETFRNVWHLPDGQTLSVVGEPHPFGGVIYLFENETETLALQRGFNALEQTQRETLDNLREGVVVFGSNGRISLSNPAFAQMWKLSRKQLDAGPHIDEVIDWCAPLMNGGNVWRKVKEIVTAMDESRVRVESELVRSDGKVLDYVTVPMPGGSTLVTFVDVTAARNVANMLREKNEALEAADRIKSDFIQHISYELRSPLTTVIGFTELLADEKSGDLTERQKGYASHVLSSSHVLMALIDDILDLASLDAGVVELERQRVNIEEIVGQVFDTVAPKLAEQNITLEKDIAADLPPLHADSQRLKQVLYNLLSNAIAYSDFGQKVTVSVLDIAGSVAFKVIDEGSGMSEEVREKVFDRFYSTPTSSAGRGAGLGLSIVKSFVELHGGTVSVSSRKNGGTTVTCMFPARRGLHGQNLEERPAE